MSGADEFAALARDFVEGGAKVGGAVYDAFKAGGEAFAADWRHNAEQTSGEHGKKYPPTIDSETRLAFGVTVTTGPNPVKGRAALAGRGYEFGSENQPPHLDGLHALPLAEKRLDKLTDAAIGFVLP